MTVRALLTWFGILVIASANGAFRAAWLIPRLGEEAGRRVSTVLLSAAVVAITWATIGWIRPTSAGDAWRIGALWVVLTLAFEFGFGHFVFGTPWRDLLADYDILRGRIWIVVLVLVAVMPYVAATRRGVIP